MSGLKIIISPAKKMNEETELLSWETLPEFLPETEKILSCLKSLSYAEAKALWKCNDKLAELNFDRLRRMELREHLTPALLSYEGIQYQYLSPRTLEEDALSYLREHLRILSGFYGVLKPFDGVTPYRLEMQAGVRLCGCKSLYEFWGGRILQGVLGEEEEATAPGLFTRPGSEAGDRETAAHSKAAERPDVILNLASKEYAKAIEPYLTEKQRFISVVFAERKDGSLRQKATLAKMARGEMVRWLAQRQITAPEEMKAFSGLGFSFSEADSGETVFTFIR